MGSLPSSRSISHGSSATGTAEGRRPLCAVRLRSSVAVVPFDLGGWVTGSSLWSARPAASPALDPGRTSPTRTAMSSRSLGVGRSRLGDKYVLGAERSSRSARLRAHYVRQRRWAGAAPQNPRMESSKAVSSVMASLSWRMRAASASLPTHSRTDA